MARFNQRLAAGVGVFVAFLLLGGSATVAVADPGRSHSDRGHSSDRGNGGGNGRGGPGRHDDGRGSNIDSSKRGEINSSKRGEVGEWKGGADPGIIESPQVRVGSGRVGAAEDTESAPSTASRSGATDSSETRLSGPDSSEAPLNRSDSSEARLDGSAPGVFGGDGPPSRSGSDHVGAPKARLDSPRVGNGREPVIVIQRGEPEPRWRPPALQPAPAAPPPLPPPPAAPAPPPLRVNPPPAPPVLTKQLGVAEATDWSNPLWGLAGLLLIPVAGAVLGYRQARAAHAVDRLRRS